MTRAFNPLLLTLGLLIITMVASADDLGKQARNHPDNGGTKKLATRCVAMRRGLEPA